MRDYLTLGTDLDNLLAIVTESRDRLDLAETYLRQMRRRRPARRPATRDAETLIRQNAA